ncbi:hypothetical protein VQ042_24790 [Aurantimonas sp. A2-1-M11]|uniref:hypothetical protein n=1 Tax=Aurantimonas sp. A2-1-M11 TaxID=3113712 RepID=UPI002F931B9B
MIGFLKNFIHKKGAGAAQHEIQQFNRYLSAGTDEELGLTLVLSLKMLENSKQKYSKKYGKALGSMNDISITSTKEDRMLASFLVAALKKDREELLTLKTRAGELGASGLAPIIHSLRVVAYPVELLPDGREMWRHLMRGERFLPIILNEQLPHKNSEGELEEFLCPPALLVPEFDRGAAAQKVREYARAA